MPFKQGNNMKPIIIGDIENEEDRAMLVRQLARYQKTLDDVEVLTIDQAEQRGLFENDAFLAYIRTMGFTSAEEMRATYARMKQNGMTGNQAPNK